MNLEEAKTHIMKVRNMCRGPFKTPDLLSQKQRLLKEGRIEEAKQIDNTGRIPCRFNLSETIASMPPSRWNGEEQNYHCPRCGMPHHFRLKLEINE